MIPATCGRDNRFDVTDSYIVPKWLALMEEKGTYSMRYFGLEGDTSGGIVTVTDFKEVRLMLECLQQVMLIWLYSNIKSMLYLPVERRYGIAHMAALLVMLYC